jgi:hypothetical protein
MKAVSILFASLLALSVSAIAAEAAPEVKKVCHADAKTHKDKCKNVKVHKMHEGTVVPEKKKK